MSLLKIMEKYYNDEENMKSEEPTKNKEIEMGSVNKEINILKKEAEETESLIYKLIEKLNPVLIISEGETCNMNPGEDKLANTPLAVTLQRINIFIEINIKHRLQNLIDSIDI